MPCYHTQATSRTHIHTTHTQNHIHARTQKTQGWQHTRDVPLTLQGAPTSSDAGGGQQQVWGGSCRVPAGQLPAAWHLDLQVSQVWVVKG